MQHWAPDTRPAAASQLLLSRAVNGDALVTLHGIAKMPQLNGMVVKLVANGVAPKAPSTGRIAVRLPDENIISVKVENATPGGAAPGQRVSVGGEVRSSAEGGWIVEQEYGEVTAVHAGGEGISVAIDSAIGKATAPRTATLSFVKDTFLFEADARFRAELISAASGWAASVDASLAPASLDEDGTEAALESAAAERSAAVTRLRTAAHAAARWLAIENHVAMRGLAALMRLELLRHIAAAQAHALVDCGPSGDAAAAEADCHAALDRAEHLASVQHYWAAFPTSMLDDMYREHCLVHLARPVMLLEQLQRRGSVRSDYSSLMHRLFTASRYADLAADAHGRFTVLCHMATCLRLFQRAESPTPIAFPSPAWPFSAGEDGEGRTPPSMKKMLAKAAALTLLEELARAYRELEWLEGGGKAEDATGEAALPPREWSSTEGVPTRVWAEARLQIRKQRAALSAWLNPGKADAMGGGVFVYGNLD